MSRWVLPLPGVRSLGVGILASCDSPLAWWAGMSFDASSRTSDIVIPGTSSLAGICFVVILNLDDLGGRSSSGPGRPCDQVLRFFPDNSAAFGLLGPWRGMCTNVTPYRLERCILGSRIP